MLPEEDILVSVLMPVYHAETYLKEAIESILNQTYKDLELLALYDDSEDGTWEILSEYAKKDERLQILMLPHHGIAAALNIGLKVAKGKYIARMDADDISLPDRFAVQVAYMEKHPDIGVCAARMNCFLDNGMCIRNQMPTAADAEEIKAGMLFQCMIGHPTVMFRRDTMIRGNWHYRSDVLCEDFELWTRMIETVPFAVVPEILLNYRYNINSLTKSRKNDVFLSSCEIVKQALERALKVDTTHYKIIDFRGIHQVVQLEEPIAENLKRQNKLLHEIYHNNLKIHYCHAGYLSKYIRLKWQSQFRNFGFMDRCSEEVMQIDVTKTDSDFSDEAAQEISSITDEWIREMRMPKNVVLYGAGMRGKRVMERWEELSSCKELAWKLMGVADKQKTQMEYSGNIIDCITPAKLLLLKYDYILVSTDIYYEQIKAELAAAGILKEKILSAGILNLLRVQYPTRIEIGSG